MYLPDEQIEYLRLLHIERGGQMTWHQIVMSNNLTDMTAEALRKKVQRYERRIEDSMGFGKPVKAPLIIEQRGGGRFKPVVPQVQLPYEKPHFENYYVDPQQAALKKKLELYEQLLKQNGVEVDEEELMYEPYPEHLDDTLEWESWQIEAGIQNEVITAMVWYDIHMPDHSAEALSLAKKILEAVQPHVLVYGGDIFDFDALSTFAKSRRRHYKDAIGEVNADWHRLNDDVDRLSPHTKRVAFKGNHDARIDRWNDMAMSPFADTTEESFVNMVRSNNRVLWLGEAQETHLGAWYIQHGKRAGDTAAKTALKDIGWATPHSQGHNHMPGMYVHRVNDGRNIGNYRVIQSASSGALCNIPPHYVRDTKMATWIHGCLVGHVNMKTDEVNLQNIIFHRRPDGTLWTVFGNQKFVSR